MAFIPIHAKADISTGEGAKKGKITPAQASILNAWCLANKTGILDCLDKCIAKEENITNVENNEAVITFGSGVLVICGRLVECEDGTKVSVKTPATGSISGKIIARFSLSSSGENEFQVLAKTGALMQQDLNLKEYMKTGTYEFELYTYTATPTTLKLERTFDYVPNIDVKVQEIVDVITNNISGTGVIGEGTPPLQAYDKSKGTIEERLTRLGFKAGTITFLGSSYGSVQNTNATTNGIFRLGNFVICNIRGTARLPTTYGEGSTFFTLPQYFRPKSSVNTTIDVFTENSTFPDVQSYQVTIKTNGNVVINRISASSNLTNMDVAFNINFGFEAPPIN